MRSVLFCSVSVAAMGVITPVVMTSRIRAGVISLMEDSVAARVAPGLSWHMAHDF